MKIEKPINKTKCKYFDKLYNIVYTVRMFKDNKELCENLIQSNLKFNYVASSLLYECIINSITNKHVMSTLKDIILIGNNEIIKYAENIDEFINDISYCIETKMIPVKNREGINYEEYNIM